MVWILVAPVHHIVALQHLHAYEVEIRSHHIIFLTYADDVGVGEIGIQHRIDIGAVALVAPSQLFRILFHKVGTGIGLLRQHLNVLEMDIAGMPDEEAFRGQVSPHRRFRIFLLLLVFQCRLNLRQVGQRDATLLVDADVRQPHVLHRMTRQTRDAAASGAGMVYLDVVEANAADASHMVDGNQLGDGVLVAVAAQRTLSFPELIAATAVAQTDEDRRLGALNGDVADRDVLQDATIDNLQRDG